MQSRRPLGDITPYQSPLSLHSVRRSVNDAAKLSSEIPKPKPKPAAELSDLELAIQASLLPEYVPVPAADGEDTAVHKVARSLKADFAFKQSPPGTAPRKLARFVEKQRVSAEKMQTAPGVKSGTMQQFRRGSGVPKKPAQIPHTVGAGDESQDSTEGGNGEDWLDFGAGKSSKSQSPRVFGDGELSKFILRR